MMAQAGESTGSAPNPTAQVANGPLVIRAVSSLAVDKVHRNVVAGRTISVRGSLKPLTGKRPVALQVRSGKSWTTVDNDHTTSAGQYSLKWRAKKVGSRRIRLEFAGSDQQTPANRGLGYANVYRSAMASWYGPGLYGNKLGCGGHLSPSTIGVAHKHLPCGTKLTLRYKGHTVRATVVDRGPFVGGREFDLTAATKQKLHFGSTGRILVAAHS
jgi:rare lipoprotein A (peptidoglycan hydrolase)